jgi:SNF2 family DNA or RNA helicase
MVDWLRDNKRCALWAGMGIGKSSATLFALDMMRLTGELGTEPILVLGPMRVARDTWPEEMAKWEQFRDLKIISLTGSESLRLKKLHAKADIFTISYELAPWLVEYWLERWPYRIVIADESDRLKGFREKKGGVGLTSKKAGHAGQRAHQLGRIAHNLTDRWINLTGTPAPNGLKDLWGQTWYLDRGERLGRTYGAFTQRWFKPKWSGHGIEPMPHSDKEIHAALADICLTIDPKDYFDLKDPIVTEIKVKLPEKARKVYKQLEKEMFAELENMQNIEAFNAADLTNKCLQVANGAVYTDYPNWSPIHDEKLEALRSIIAESGGSPILVAYSFKSDVARLKRAFPTAVELSTELGMAAFRGGDSPIGLAHPKSMGHGIDGLQHVTNILVRFGHSWNLGERMQMLERIGPMRQMQAGLERAVYVYDIVAESTVDEDVIEAHAAKRSVQDALLLAMKRRES